MAIITLLSDLGTRDASLPVAKAILMRHAPAPVIVDVSHNVAQYDLQQAAYMLLSAYKHFPAGTLHLIMVDVFSGDAPRLALAEKDGYFFIAPDNGILSLAFGTELENTRLCYTCTKPYIFNDWLNNAGLAIKSVHDSTALSPYAPHALQQAPPLLQPIITRDGIECKILFIDRYENVILNITRPQFDELVQGRPFRIMLSRLEEVTAISSNYNDVPRGKALCRFNDSGFMEIALNHAGAATLLGLTSVATGNLRYRTIKIFF